MEHNRGKSHPVYRYVVLISDSIVWFSSYPILIHRPLLFCEGSKGITEGRKKRGEDRRSSSSSRRTACTDLRDPLSAPPVFYHPSLLQATCCIDTEQLYIGSSWSSCLCSSMWRGPQEYVAYEFILTSPPVYRMSGSSNLGGRCLHSCCVIAVKLFLCTFS